MRKKLAVITVILFILAALLSVFRGCGGHKNIEEELPQDTAAPVRSVIITACGDCTLATDVNFAYDGSFKNYADTRDYSYFFEKVRDIFEEDDLTIVNFEGTLSENGSRADKTFAFRGNPEYVNILTSSSVEAANLANNHSSDYGEISFKDTQEILERAGIANFCGTDFRIVQINGINVGLAGVNALNDAEGARLEEVVRNVKEQGAELVILSIHWGVEKDTEPGSEQIRLAHAAIDSGADLVLGTHPHVLQGIEKYNGRYIFYSMGNFCFGGNSNPSDKDTAIWRQTFTFEDGSLLDDDNYEIIPCRISGANGYNNYQPTPASGSQRTAIEDKLLRYSGDLGTAELNFRTE